MKLWNKAAVLKNKKSQFKMNRLFFWIILTVLIPCEMYQNYLDRFNDFTNVTFYCPEDMSINTMLKEISDTADMHNILIFKINNVKKSLFYSEITSYADTNAKKYWCIRRRFGFSRIFPYLQAVQ